jgi:LPXTG-site transpeptidase (sortase) family protein
MKIYQTAHLTTALGLILLATACQPAESIDANPTLPTPVLINLPSSTPRVPTSTPTLPPNPTDQPMDLAGLARSVYGERLIEFIRIPAINIWAPVTPVGWQAEGDPADPVSTDWDSPAAKVGWMVTSALPDDHTGNVILYGHNNIESSVFLNLYLLKTGDLVRLQTGLGEFDYKVFTVNILPVTDKAKDYEAYQAYLQTSIDQCLTLVSCYPPVSNTHRVVVVAYPVKK